MSKPRIFINIHYMEIGGAERALLGLLSTFDPQKVDVELFINQHTGEFMSLIPDYVNILPEDTLYSCIERPMKDVFMEGHWDIILKRLRGIYRHNNYKKKLDKSQREKDTSILQYISDSVISGLPDFSYLGEYDLAISFLNPHNIVATKVKAKKKICWIHTDYSAIHINKEQEFSIWQAFDNIISISPDCTNSFLNVFPQFKDRIIMIENILSPYFVHQQANEFNVSHEMPNEEGVIKILTIGRFCAPKNIEGIPYICKIMEDMGINFKWYIIGYGPDQEIQTALDKYRMRARMIILGKKKNPYPYIKACDIYIQPSKYEGKSVTVREAQILHKPVVITNYPTASSQINDGLDGKIVSLNRQETAKEIASFINNYNLQNRIRDYLRVHDYGNEIEINKIYSLLNVL